MKRNAASRPPKYLADSSVKTHPKLRRIVKAAHGPGWGILDQAIYAGTNFAAVVLVARVLGAEPFGAFALVLAVWAAMWSVGRAVFAEPFTIRASALPDEGWRREACLASGAILGASVVTGLAMAVAALVLPLGALVSNTLLVLALIVPFLLLQDFWRVAAFGRDAGHLAVVNDTVWGVAQFAGFGLLWALDAFSAPAAMAAWGAGAFFGCLAGWAQFRVRPSLNREAVQWARDAFRLGGWFAVARSIRSASMQISFIIAGFMLQLAAIGGLRSAYTVFGPLANLQRGIRLPALPAMVRVEESAVAGVLLRFVGILGGVSLAYTGLIVLGGSGLLRVMFGADFTGYANLLLPIGIAHIALLCGTPISLALQRLGVARGLASMEVALTPPSLILIVVMTAAFGLMGCAIAFALGNVLRVAGLWWLLSERLKQIPSPVEGQEQAAPGGQARVHGARAS